MNELALFAGAGGGILGGKLLGWRTVCAVEYEPYAAGVLAQRQNDGLLPPFPIWDDVRTFDGTPWSGIVDVVSGGFPCQDISAAGAGNGLEGEQSGLWVEMARIIGEVRPRFVLVENSPMLTSRGLGTVLGDLATLGFDARWGVLGAADVGAPHQRDRIWIVANASGGRCVQQEGGEMEQPRGTEIEHASETMADTQGKRCGEAGQFRCEQPAQWITRSGKKVHDANSLDRLEVWRQAQGEGGHAGQPDSRDRTDGTILDWPIEPDVGRVAYGVAGRVDKLKCLGNGQVPKCAAYAWRLLTN